MDCPSILAPLPRPDLAAKARYQVDVVNHIKMDRPGALKKLSLGYDTLSKDNPGRLLFDPGFSEAETDATEANGALFPLRNHRF